MTPIGINLPNDQTVRERYGSKSVSLSNVNEAYDKSTLPEFRSEFSWTPEEAERAAKWSALAGELTTNMHEVIGHASGKVEERLKGNPQAALKEQFSALEEARADLVALYFLPDPKLVELGLVAEEDHDEIVRAEYEAYTRNALVQLRRVREGTQLEEDHMRNRQMIVRWLMANTKAIEVRTRDGKTYYVMTDPQAFREGVGRLLAEVQRIKAEGDYAAAKQLFETHGVHFDPKLRDEVVARVDQLNLPSYTGFVMPKLEAVTGPVGRNHRRAHLVSAGSARADARILGRNAAAAAVNVLVPHARRSHAEPPRRYAGGRPGPGPDDYRSHGIEPDARRLRVPGRSASPARRLPRTDLCAPRPSACRTPRAAVARDFARRGLSVTPGADRADGQHERGVRMPLQAVWPMPATRCWFRGQAIRCSIIWPGSSSSRRVPTISIPTAVGVSTSTLSRTRSPRERARSCSCRPTTRPARSSPPRSSSALPRSARPASSP